MKNYNNISKNYQKNKILRKSLTSFNNCSNDLINNESQCNYYECEKNPKNIKKYENIKKKHSIFYIKYSPDLNKKNNICKEFEKLSNSTQNENYTQRNIINKSNDFNRIFELEHSNLDNISNYINQLTNLYENQQKIIYNLAENNRILNSKLNQQKNKI